MFFNGLFLCSRGISGSRDERFPRAGCEDVGVMSQKGAGRRGEGDPRLYKAVESSQQP